MSRGYSRIILVGNIGRDPEMRYSQTGTPITNFTMAVNRRRRQADGNYADETDWYRVSLFRQQAENAAEWLKRGNRVLVEGQFQLRTYTGNDGVERTAAEVIADNFMNLTPRDEFGGSDQGQRPPQRREERGPTPINGGRGPARSADRTDAFDDDDFDDVPF
jgi:single-strand DNA-binding protein